MRSLIRLIRLLILIGLASGAALAQGSPYQITNMPGATIQVCSFPAAGNPCSNIATIYADSADTTPISQPVNLGSTGNITFYVPGGTYVIQFSGATSQSLTVNIGGGSSLPQGAGNFGQDAFVWTTACGGRTNCFQGVDDDSTDNCGSALTSFMSSVNAGATPGRTQMFIEGAGIGKAYRLATSGCNIALTNANGLALHLWATIDCAQTADNCVQLGPTGQSSEQGGENYRIDGFGGTLFGGVNLTTAGIHVEPGVDVFRIDGIQFLGLNNSTHQGGFGANSVSPGTCVNSLIFVDSPVAAGYVTNTGGGISGASSTSGGCGFLNPNGSVSGTNTVYFVGNTMGGNGVVGASTVGCPSEGIVDGGSYGGIRDNNIYGVAIPIRIQGIGHRVEGNQLDAAGCTANGVSANIEWGATSSSTAVGPNTISNNVGQIFTSHATNLLAQAGDSTALLTSTTITGNENAGGGTTANNNLMPANSCTPGIVLTWCYEYGNENLLQMYPCGASSSGWVVGNIAAACQFSGSGSTNLTATTILTAPSPNFPAPLALSCDVVITTAATTSSTLPQCVFSWTDNQTNVVQTVTATPVWASGTVGCSGSTTNTVGNSCKGSIAWANVKTGTAITVSTINAASTGATPVAWSVNVTATLVQN